MKVLIADDEHIIRFGLKLVLKSLWEDAEVDEAEDINQVVNLVAQETYDLVVLDINMPGGNGLENLIRFMPDETKVTIFSSHNKNSTRIRSLREAGVDEFVFKDASILQLKQSLLKCFKSS